MKIIIPGGSGHVGTVLGRAFERDGHDVIVLSRKADRSPFTTITWDGRTLGGWVDVLDGADVLVNLAGSTVNCRYTRANRNGIMDSRISSTRALGDALAQCSNPPRTWLQASTATIYAHRFDAPNDEATGTIGGHEADAPSSWRFSIDVARSWENTLDDAKTPKTRKVKLRSAMTMSVERDGIFDVLLGLVRRGLGGTSGDGRQYVSWVHHEDFVRAIYWLIEHEEIEGVVNISSPNPLPNAEFMQALRKAWGAPIGLPATKWMLGTGAILIRTETELILKSRRVVPRLLLEHGFSFRYPDWSQAAQSLCAEWRAARVGSYR